jgi:hypothetical protein
MFVEGVAVSTRPVVADIYYYVRGILIAAATPLIGSAGATLIIKFQAIDITTGATVEKVY